jgi:hypothetical protein
MTALSVTSNRETNAVPTDHPDPSADMATLRQLVDALRDDVAALRRENRHQFRQLEALFSLFTVLQPRSALPPLGGWRVSPDFAVILMELIQQHRPDTVLELGGGASTIVTAYALERWNPGGRVVGLEHQADFVQVSNHRLQQHGFAPKRARVVNAPLQDLRLDTTPDITWAWYDPRSLKSLSQVDVLVVDGPPQYGNPVRMVRYPALQMLQDFLRPDTLILLDDMGREDEQRVVGRWLNEFPVRIEREYETEKGALLLRWGAV